MTESFSFLRFVLLGGAMAAPSTIFGLYGFEPMAQRWGWQCPVALLLIVWAVTGIACIDLSRKLPMKWILIIGLTGWFLHFGSMAFELHRRGWWP